MYQLTERYSVFTQLMKNWQQIRNQKISKNTFILRSKIIDLIREWFRQEGFLEVETPLLVKYPGMEPHLDPFSSEFITKDKQTQDCHYFHTSPEYSMKKLLGAGFDKIFQISKVFRNGEIGDLHNPEFTMLEWYRTNSDYQNIMTDTESLIKHISKNLQNDTPKLSTLNHQWEKLSVREAFQKYAQIYLDELRDIEKLSKEVKQKGYELNTNYDWDDLFFLIFLNEIEPKLGFDKPVFLYDYPASQAALAKKKETDPFWAERFELYINGIELCNAFSELIDPDEQRYRLEEEQALRKKIGKEVFEIDESFLEALETMPPSGGNALGIDRLIMLLLGKEKIQDILLFPWQDVT